MKKKKHRNALLMIRKTIDFMARKFQTTKMNLEGKIKVEIKLRK